MAPLALAALWPLLLGWWADIVHLKSGGRIEGRVVAREGGKVRIETRFGTVEVPESDVERIEETPWEPPAKRPEAPAPEMREPPVLGDTFREPWHNFRLMLPKRWQQGKTDGGASVTLEGPADGLYRPQMHLFFESNPAALLEFAEKHREQVRGSGEIRDVRFKIIAVEKVGPHEAVLARADYTDGLVAIQTSWCFVDGGGGRKATLMWTCFAKLAERYEDLLHASMRSFRLFAPNAATAGKRAMFHQLVRDAGSAREAGRIPEAERALAEAAEIAPNFPEIHNQLGEALANQRKFEAAERRFRRAREIDPENAAYALNLSKILASRRKDGEALEFARKAAELDPALPAARLNLADAYLRLGNLSQAESEYVAALEKAPESVEGHYGLGATYESQGRLDRAEREYRDALKLDPQHAGAKEGLRRIEASR